MGASLRPVMLARKIWLVPLAILASAVAATLIDYDYPNIVDVLELADPTGSFGVYFHIGGLAANLSVIFVACVILVGVRANFRIGYAVVVFIPSILEAISALPCFLGSRPGALCGIGLVFFSWLAVPVVIIATVAFVLTSGKLVRAAGSVAALAFVGYAAAAYTLLAPSGPDQCRAYSEVTKRSNCLKVLAVRTGDEGLCRSVEFRTTRFACLVDAAAKKQQASLCGEIEDASSVPAYESPAALYRDACFQNLAYATRDRSLCGKVGDRQLRARCEKSLR